MERHDAFTSPSLFPRMKIQRTEKLGRLHG
jgi:hypothetical protein